MREVSIAAVRDTLDFYRTPENAVRAILPHVPLEGRILEPSAGDGAILEVLRTEGVPPERLHGVELAPHRATAARRFCAVDEGDFLQWQPPGRYDLVITNPPYGVAQQFVEKALGLGTHVAMLLRLGFLESKTRSAFHRAHPADVFVFAGRPRFTGLKQTYPAAFAWFVWGPGRGNRWTIL